MEIFAEFSHVVMFAREFYFVTGCCVCFHSIPFRTVLLVYAVSRSSLYAKQEKTVCSQKVFLFKNVFIRLLTVSPDIVSFRMVYGCVLCVCVGPFLCHYLSYGFWVHFCYFFYCCHCHWFPVVSQIVHRAPKKYFDLMEAICIFQDLWV